MNRENFNSELSKRLNQPESKIRGRGRAIIDQLINYIEENDWYCIQYWDESNLHECEKALWQGLLESFMEGKK